MSPRKGLSKQNVKNKVLSRPYSKKKIVTASESRAAQSVVTNLLKPIVELVYAFGVSVGEFEELFRETAVHVAASKQLGTRARINIAGISAISGLSRGEIARILNRTRGGQSHRYPASTGLSRVLTGWVRDSRFCNKAGRPLDLPMFGKGATFQALTSKYAPSLPARAVLEELVSRKSIVILSGQNVRLVSMAPSVHPETAKNLGRKAAAVLEHLASKIFDKSVILRVKTASFNGIHAPTNHLEEIVREISKFIRQLHSVYARKTRKKIRIGGERKPSSFKITIVVGEMAAESSQATIKKRRNYRRQR